MHSSWSDMLTLGVPLAEKIIRPIVVYFFLIILLRVFGKRELAQLNPFDLVVLLSLANTVQNAIIGNDTSLIGGLIGALALLSVNYLVVRYLFGHRRLDQIVEGKPSVLVESGRVMKDELARELMTEAELQTVIHRQGFTSIEEVDRCVLEPGGVFWINGKTPPKSDRHQTELLQHLQDLSEEVKALRQIIDRGQPPLPVGKP
jgi:uncharacterized membrane protein YcaP (DUF421 family)